jgi:hypothetical protein
MSIPQYSLGISVRGLFRVGVRTALTVNKLDREEYEPPVVTDIKPVTVVIGVDPLPLSPLGDEDL